MQCPKCGYCSSCGKSNEFQFYPNSPGWPIQNAQVWNGIIPPCNTVSAEPKFYPYPNLEISCFNENI